MKKKILIYNHGGSGNHGCEALVRTIVNKLPESCKITLLSDSPEEDFYYGINEIVDRILPSMKKYSKLSVSFIKAYTALKKNGNYTYMDLLPYEATLKDLDNYYDAAISIGGDVYCYENYPMYIGIHQMIKKKAKKTYLIGCSLEETLFNDAEMIKELKSFDHITARETMTYDLLKKHDIHQVSYIPDSAFTLEKRSCTVPEGVKGSIGINVSPLVSERGSSNSAVYDNYSYLIKKILESTDYTVTLIPHVVWKDNDDSTILKQLYDEYSGSGRLVLIEDHNCMELKYIISQCRFFIGARTHATIAAYSSCVPTLVVGYSIKSRGIAKDLFGTDDQYVISVQSLKKDSDLWDAFQYVLNNERSIIDNLQQTIPEIVLKTETIGELIDE